jgi:ABC-type transport system involved in cytochrome c biogenesis permease subunit
MKPFALEMTLHWVAVAAYIAATHLFAYAILFDKPARVRWALWVTAVGLLPHAAALVIRYFAVGHGPYMLKYEVLSSNAWVVIVMLLLFVWRRPNWAAAAVVALSASIVMVGFALFSSPEARDLPPTLRSIWLIFHVVFNYLAVGAFLLSVAAAVVLLRKLHNGSSRWLDRLPAPDALAAQTIRFVGLGLVLWVTMIVTGAIWANQAWGRYWGWDPMETWSLVTWLCYAALLHAHLFFRLKARAIAWGTIGCFVSSVLTVFIFPFLIPTLHSAYFQ